MNVTKSRLWLFSTIATVLLLEQESTFFKLCMHTYFDQKWTEIIVILAAVVVYKAAKKDCSVTEGMTHYDVNRASRAQYIMAMLINKNSAFGKFGEHQASLIKKKMPLVLSSVVSTLTLPLRLWRIKNALGQIVASILPCLEDREAMSFSAFDNYNAILATISF